MTTIIWAISKPIGEGSQEIQMDEVESPQAHSQASWQKRLKANSSLFYIAILEIGDVDQQLFAL